jgi:sarcosine oxidase subunit alpha
LSTDSESIAFSLDGERLLGRAGDTLAAALLRNGVTTFTRSIKYHRPRGPFCFAGSCGQCLLRVDGVPSLPACRVPLREGLACERQNAPTGAENDFFRAVDFLYPGGLDHHHLMVQSRLLGRVALEVARRLAGLGTLPARVQAAVPGAVREAQVAIVGAGPAGLAAARAAQEAGARAIVLDRDARAGGAALIAIDPAAPSAASLADQARAVEQSGGEVLLDAEVVGLYPAGDEARPALLAVREGDRLTALRAERVIVATGGAPQPLPFAGVDRPGVYAARGLVQLARSCRVLVRAQPARPGEDAPALALVGEGRELLDCARALAREGYALARVVDAGDEPVAQPPGDLPLLRATPLRARGEPVRELQVQVAGQGKTEAEPGGTVEAIRCDAVALAFPPAPAHELASAAGARASFVQGANGFPVEVDGEGRTCVRWLFAAGTAAGQGGARAAASGAAAGRAAAKSLREGA